MDDLGKLRKDLDGKRKAVDSEIRKLEKELHIEKVRKPAKKKQLKEKVKFIKPAEKKPVKQIKPSEVKPSKPHKLFKHIFESVHHTRRMIAGSALLVLSILLIAILAFMFTRTITKEEFVSRVQSCKSGTYLDQVDNSLVKYSTKNCQVVKEITYVGDLEPREIQVLFEGKKMTCEYRRGQFNFDHLDYFLKDIDVCWGDLKDILIELRGYRLGRSRGI